MNTPVLHKEIAPKDLDQLLKQAKSASCLLKVLSHEARLTILFLLSASERSVSELERILTLPQAAVSQQLAKLRQEGLVHSRREGRMIYYSLMNDDVSSIISCLHDLLCKHKRP